MVDETNAYFKGMNANLKQGQANSILLDMASKKLDAIIEGSEQPDLDNQERKLMKLMEFNVWNIYESKNTERQMTVEFEKYIQSASEIQGGLDVGSYTAFQFLCMNEKLQEKKNTTR